jgi:nitric oxide dioxygenase
VFASAGMGIAPMAGMLSHLVTAGSDLSIILLHADVHERTFALRRQVVSDILALRNAAIHLWYEEGAQTYEPVTGCHTGMMDLSQVDLPANATYYLCGPLPFMQAVRSALIARQVSPRDIQYEVFGPDLWQADFD